MNPIHRHAVIALLLGALVAACSPSGQAPAAGPGTAAADPRAEQDLVAYKQLIAAGSHEIAVTMGNEILRKYPKSSAAAEVRRTIAEVQATAKATTDNKRLKALWAYQVGEQRGGAQSAASIYSSEPASEKERMRLILRRHADWGESAYVFADGKGFKCPAPCALTLRFDDQPGEKWKAFTPETGEPAIFIEEDRKFAQRLTQTRKVAIDATLVDRGPTKIVFETGGFDPAQWLPLPK
jgi:hypothetical protein